MLRRPAALAALLLTLTACGGEERRTAGTPSPADPSTATSTPSPSASPTTPTPAPTTTSGPTPTATPTAVPPSPTPTSGGALEGGGASSDSCRPQPGPTLLQRPLRATRSMLIEDIGVYPGGLPVRGAWVARTPAGAPDLVSTVAWPDGFSAEARRTYGWDDRTEAITERLDRGRYHLFLVLDLRAGDTLDGLDVVWSDGRATGSLVLPGKVTVGNCG